MPNIVHCKDCKFNIRNPKYFYDKEKTLTFIWCQHFSDEDFCSRGKAIDDGVWCDEDMHLETDRWIAVGERLPNKNECGYYLVTVKGYRLFVDVVPFNEKLWKGLSSNQEVLAWMPLPKPYKAESEKNHEG